MTFNTTAKSHFSDETFFIVVVVGWAITTVPIIYGCYYFL
jgi:hypothetical protein